jgi:hypothetical protein
MDYTSVENVKRYNPADGTTDDVLFAELVTAYSQQVDDYCQMTFGRATYDSVVMPSTAVKIDADGLLRVHLPVPTIVSLDSLAWKLGTSTTWITLDLAGAELEDRPDGSLIRVLTPTFKTYRGQRVQARVSYVGGWEDLAAVPAGFELNTRRLVFWGYKKREAVQEKTAMPEMGIVVYPSDWPPDIKRGYANYKRGF